MDPPDGASLNHDAAGADTRREEDDQEMTDAPPQANNASPEVTQFTESRFLPPNLETNSPPSSQPSQLAAQTTAATTNESATPTNDNNNDTLPVSSTDKTNMAPAKKKGQASAKKAPKKPPKSSGASSTPKAAKKPGGGGGKKKAPTTSSTAPDDSEDEDDESDNGPYCICRGPDDHRFMIGCDICEDWFHGECVNISKEVGENLIERFVCPNCTDVQAGAQTLFKKTCSYRDCFKPARLYEGQEDDGRKKKKKGGKDGKDGPGAPTRSAFCSDEHRQMWWERMVSSLPRRNNVDPAMRDELTQEELVALLGSNLVAADKESGALKVTKRPFAPPEDQDEGGDTKNALPVGTLTAEEEDLLSTSASERYKMGEEIVLCQKMLQLVDMASERRKALIAAKQLDDTACGYDSRLDTVGAQAPFARFMNMEEGKEIFRTGSLDTGSADGNANGNGNGAEANSGGNATVCDKKRCKPHQGWYNIHTRDVKYQMKLLAADAQKQLSREKDIRDAAVERALRKAMEVNHVQYFDREGNLLPRGAVPGTA